ncbi:hypothetical protein SIO70_24205 [Chitinophaga sancti]|uniref:hypothetical protein n=1 Tax=Chitinophaga sancti TaxID=1004 RepID=UPI002A75EC0B|nr:hypothetical protein [Chitinophaga sancti]WPQ61467.1 hypothetical protein SIO70_24205 [Chitinophaga sancti]
MKKIILASLVVFAGIISCRNGDVKKNESDSSTTIVYNKKDSVKGAIQSHELRQFTTDDCNQLLNRLFQTSSFESAFEKSNLVVSVDEVADSIVAIKVESKQGQNLTVGWMSLDLRRKELTDITKDPDAPVILRYDKKMLDSLLAGCNFKSTE